MGDPLAAYPGHTGTLSAAIEPRLDPAWFRGHTHTRGQAAALCLPGQFWGTPGLTLGLSSNCCHQH